LSKEDIVPEVTRRQFLFLVPTTVIAVACDKAPTTPQSAPQPMTLLKLLQATGYNAREKVVGDGKLIEINGSIRWNFKVNDQIIGLGSSNVENLDVTAILVKPTDQWSLTPA